MRLGCCSSFWGHTVTAVAVPPLVHGGNIQYLVTVGKKLKPMPSLFPFVTRLPDDVLVRLLLD